MPEAKTDPILTEGTEATLAGGIFNINFTEVISKISKLVDDVYDKGIEVTVWGVTIKISLPK